GLQYEALQLAVPEAAFSHRTAARIFAVPLRDWFRLIEMTVAPPKSPPRRKGVKGYERALGPGDVITWRGLRVTSGARTIADLASLIPKQELVVIGDDMLRRGLTTPEELLAMLEISHVGKRGLVAARWAVPRMDGRSGSPQESRTRLRFEDEGLPRPECNVEVYDCTGGYVACPDLVLKEAKLAVEFDGEHHLTTEQQRSDAIRDRLLIAAGWVSLRATSRDLDRRNTDLWDTIRALLIERSSWRPQ
ncbi:MAG TPA: DUF559 domain-containing protein, partial [Acidothermaceae bacterium]|nr:DUF559 domain-containing protein [Acidothermaceae bacterium]